ncbi:MAG: hypothetical protein IT458_13645, partial [Planctomycetes bacterium]|nr:hypothetical protein [Planctomycetota bacterium]
LALWWALRACVPAPLALLAGVWLATSPVVLESTTIGGYPIPHVYTFHAFLVAIAVGCVARGRVAAGALVLAAAVTDRAEFAPWFLCFAILASAASPLRAHRSMALVLAGLALVLLAVPLLHAGHRERSWLAFRQHYARGAVYQDLLREWAEGGGSLDPQRVQTAARDLEAAFTHPDERVQRDFPGAASLADALRIDPARLLGHVERNLCMLPASLSVTLSSTLLPPALPWWSLAALGGCVAAGWWRRRHAAGPSGSDPRRLLPVFLLTSPAALLVPLVVWSRPELALPVFPLAAWIVCGGACGLLPSGERWRRRLALAGPALVLGIAWLVPGPFTGPAPALQHRDSLELLRRCLPPGEVRLLSTWTAFQLRLLERPGIAAVTLGAPGDRTFAQVLAEERVDHVLRTPQLELQASGLKDLATTLEGNGWREVARQNAVRLYAREERGR